MLKVIATTLLILIASVNLPAQTGGKVLIGYYEGYAYYKAPPSVMDYNLYTHNTYFGIVPKTTAPYYDFGTPDAPAQGKLAMWRAIRDSSHKHGRYAGFSIAAVRHYYSAGEAAFETIIADSALSERATTEYAYLAQSEGADYVDVDHEDPSGGAQYKYERFYRMLSQKLHTIGVYLTAAVYPLTDPAGSGAAVTDWATPKCKTYFKYVFLMWYEMCSGRGGERNLGHSGGGINRPTHCNYDGFCLSDNGHLGYDYIGPKGYEAMGWKKEQIVLGLGLYLHTFSRAGTTPINLCTPVNTLTRHWGSYQEMTKLETEFAGAETFYDPVAQAEHKKITKNNVSWFLTYESEVSLRAKALWITQNEYAGAGAWSAWTAYMPGYPDPWRYPRYLSEALGVYGVPIPPPDTTTPPPDTTTTPPAPCDTLGAFTRGYNAGFTAGAADYKARVPDSVATVVRVSIPVPKP